MADISKITSLLGFCPSTTDKVIQQRGNIHLLEWEETANTKAFWNEVKRYRDAAGLNPFEELATAAVSVLPLPTPKR